MNEVLECDRITKSYSVVRFIVLYKRTLTFCFCMKSKRMNVQMETTEKYIPVMLFDNSNERC